MAVHVYIYYEYCLYKWSVSAIYPHMNSWVLDEWLYNEILRNITELKKTLTNQKKKPHTYTKHWRTTMNPWLWRHLHFIFKQFSRRKLTHQLLGTSPSFIHELRISVIKFIEEILYWLDKHAVIEFTLTLTSCPFQKYLAESRMVGIQTGSALKSLVIH